MQNHLRNCPGCQTQSHSEVGVKNNFHYVKCINCQTIYTDLLPTETESEKQYAEYYDEKNLNIPDFIYQRLKEIIDSFSSFRKNNRLLDVGFGAGTLMEVARQEKWETFGIEVSKPAVENAQKKGFNVFYGDLNKANYPDNYFDVITASEIIEHCNIPEELLTEVKRILRPGGLFWGTTPSASGISYKLMGVKWSVLSPPDHLQLFSPKAIKHIFKQTNFESIKITTLGFGVSEVIYEYKNLIKSKNNSVNSFNRVQSDYALNESLTKNKSRKMIKDLLNNTLNVLRIGDSLKIRAIK